MSLVFSFYSLVAAYNIQGLRKKLSITFQALKDLSSQNNYPEPDPAGW